MIYFDTGLKKSYKRFYWRHNDRYIVVLWGFQVSLTNVIRIEPVYLALLRLWASAGILHIEFPWFHILLMRRKPWVWIQKVNHATVEEG